VSRRVTGITAAFLASVLAVGPVCAQTRLDEPASRDPRLESDLPVSLERIRRELAAQTTTRERRDGLRLDYYVQVYGKAPRLELYSPQINLTNAPVMYGGMTHQEFLGLVTPEEFRAPAADIPGAIAALIKWAMDKKKPSTPAR
jgi:hypothetical protein